MIFLRISTKCSIALHLLTVLHVLRHHKLTSELLAKSVGCNPVMVRKILGNLKAAGIVEIRRGTGGATLVADPEKLTLWDVYQAVDETPVKDIIGIHPNPSLICPVGRSIENLLEVPYSMISKTLEEAMKGYTLMQIVEGYYAIGEKEKMEESKSDYRGTG